MANLEKSKEKGSSRCITAAKRNNQMKELCLMFSSNKNQQNRNN